MSCCAQIPNLYQEINQEYYMSDTTTTDTTAIANQTPAAPATTDTTAQATTVPTGPMTPQQRMQMMQNRAQAAPMTPEERQAQQERMARQDYLRELQVIQTLNTTNKDVPSMQPIVELANQNFIRKYQNLS